MSFMASNNSIRKVQILSDARILRMVDVLEKMEFENVDAHIAEFVHANAEQLVTLILTTE